jgi:hypothetical protein
MQGAGEIERDGKAKDPKSAANYSASRTTPKVKLRKHTDDGNL